ncbi:hypothetical protein [Arthrobacter citreus]|uniref:hypothetical protein n=1 Tax=Arthrobacter citreus TaxID=1670 RepID=UPI00126438DD
MNRTLVAEWDGEPVYAGIIWDWDYDLDRRVLTVKHADFWSILSRRLLFTTDLSKIATQKLVHASRSLWDLARKTVEAGTVGVFSLPVVYQGGGSGAHSRTYYGYSLPRVLDALEEIMNISGGPDVVFDPRWSADGSSLEYLMWDAADPGGALEFNLSAESCGLFGVRVRNDAQNMATIVIGTGEGSEKKMLTRAATTATTVHLMGDASFPQEKELAVLQQRTDAKLNLLKRPTEQWSAKLLASATQRVTLLKLGRTIRVYTKGDPMISDGYRTLRLIQYSGSLGETIDLEFQQIGA